MASRAPDFAGSAFAMAAGDIDAWARGAASGERLAYCEAPDLIRGEGAARARALDEAGLVTLVRARRTGGGWQFLAVRTGKAWPSVRAGGAPSILEDPATDTIFRAIKRAANLGLRCPSDGELRDHVAAACEQPGFTKPQAQWRVRKLADAGLIRSRLVVEGGESWRVVEVDGKITQRPPLMAARIAAARGEG